MNLLSNISDWSKSSLQSMKMIDLLETNDIWIISQQLLKYPPPSTNKTRHVSDTCVTGNGIITCQTRVLCHVSDTCVVSRALPDRPIESSWVTLDKLVTFCSQGLRQMIPLQNSDTCCLTLLYFLIICIFRNISWGKSFLYKYSYLLNFK